MGCRGKAEIFSYLRYVEKHDTINHQNHPKQHRKNRRPITMKTALPETRNHKTRTVKYDPIRGATTTTKCQAMANGLGIGCWDCAEYWQCWNDGKTARAAITTKAARRTANAEETRQRPVSGKNS
jgi:hypothetical protein